MTSQQLDDEKIFHFARKLPDQATRSEYFDQVCAGDQALRERVEALLAIHEQEQVFLKSAAPEVAPTVDQKPILEAPGQEIGRYKLLQKIGEGGFGVVFMAEQIRPIRRKVALKVIKPGMDSSAVVARFEAERQALAMMDHASIARVLDGGATDSGRPYFVMELVKGVAITEYCDKNQLPTEERLKLFMSVCQAVQHAHQKGIIHRDLKPSNVLVTLADGQPVVKVIDFGVAKAMNQQLTDKTLFTAYGQMVGTPQYMSPEQAEMSCLDVDTRSDVYSLGVILYELLTGSTPLESEKLRTAGYAEMQRLIRDEAPPKPSVRLSTSGDKLTVIAKHRSVSAEKLKSKVRGDLDWIVMKALEKDRNRRYESAISLYRDVCRFEAGEPIDARPPSIGYLISRTAYRHKFVISAAALIATTLTLATSFSTFWALRANTATTKANRQSEIATALSRESDQRAEDYRQLLYLADMRAAQAAWQENDVAGVQNWISKYATAPPGKKDLRQFEWFYLQNEVDRAQLDLVWEHKNNAAHSVSCSSDGLIAWALHGFIEVYDKKQRSVVDTFRTKADNEFNPLPGIESSGSWAFPFAIFSDKGRELAYPDVDLETLVIHDFMNDREIRLPGHHGAVRSAAFSPDGSLIATGSHNGQVRIWDIQKGSVIASHSDHTDLIWEVAFSPNGDQIASASADGLIVVWTRATDSRRPLRGHFDRFTSTRGVISLDFSPNGKSLVSGGADRTIQIWDIESEQQLGVLWGHTDEVRSVRFSPDGKTIASGGRDGMFRIWDVKSHKCLRAQRASESVVHSVAFDPADSQLLTASFDGSIKSWDLDSLSADISWTDARPNNVAISPDGKLVAVCSRNRSKISIWRPSENSAGSQYQLEAGEAVDGVALSNRHLLAIQLTNGKVLFCDLEPLISIADWNDETMKKVEIEETPLRAKLQSRPGGYTRSRGDIEFSEKGNFLAITDVKGRIFILDPTTLEQKQYQFGDQDILAVDFDGEDLFGLSVSGSIYRLKCRTGETQRIHSLKLSDVDTMMSRYESLRHTISASNGRVAVASDGIMIYQLDSQMETWLPYPSPFQSELCFLDATIVVFCDADGAIRFWDISSKCERFAIHEHNGAVYNLGVTQDGNAIVTAGADGEVRIWRNGL